MANPRYTTIDRGRKVYDFSLYLIFGADGSVRMSRGEPDLARGERAMHMRVVLPFALFNIPTLKATIAVDEPAVAIPPIDLEVAGDALKKALGVDIDIQIKPVDVDP